MRLVRPGSKSVNTAVDVGAGQLLAVAGAEQQAAGRLAVEAGQHVGDREIQPRDVLGRRVALAELDVAPGLALEQRLDLAELVALAAVLVDLADVGGVVGRDRELDVGAGARSSWATRAVKRSRETEMLLSTK